MSIKINWYLQNAFFKRNKNAMMQISVCRLSLSWTALLSIAFIQEIDVFDLIVWDLEEVFVQNYRFSGSYLIKMVTVNQRGQGRIIAVISLIKLNLFNKLSYRKLRTLNIVNIRLIN
jgi:hypothetical protein